MYGGEYSNKKGKTTFTPNINKANNTKKVFPKKISMFGNIKNKPKNNSQSKSNRTFEITKGYSVSNSGNLKMLNELKGVN